LRENDAVRIYAEPDRIIIQKVAETKHRTLKERLLGYTDAYTFEEWDTGAPVGTEIW